MTEPDAPVQPDPVEAPVEDAPEPASEPVADAPVEPMPLNEDRIFSPSRNADGSIAEKNPVFVGPVEETIAAIKAQFVALGHSVEDAEAKAKAEVEKFHKDKQS